MRYCKEVYSYILYFLYATRIYDEEKGEGKETSEKESYPKKVGVPLILIFPSTVIFEVELLNLKSSS